MKFYEIIIEGALFWDNSDNIILIIAVKKHTVIEYTEYQFPKEHNSAY